MSVAFQADAFQENSFQAAAGTVGPAFQANAFQANAFQENASAAGPAFQANAFQFNAFQEDHAAAPQQQSAGGGGGGPSRPVRVSTRRIEERARQDEFLRRLIEQAERGGVAEDASAAIKIIADAMAPAALAVSASSNPVPYVDAVKSKLDAIQRVNEQIETLVAIQKDDEDVILALALAA